MSHCRPHPIPFATVGDRIRTRRVKGVVEAVATGHGWPCYRVGIEWVGHEHLTGEPSK